MISALKLNLCECWAIGKPIQASKSTQQGASQEEKRDKLTALWTIFSFLNHSCNHNTSRYSIGNFIFIRAIKPIREGEEITTFYLPPDTKFEERQSLLLNTFGFTCQCENCEGYRQLSISEKELIAEIDDSFRLKFSNFKDHLEVYENLYAIAKQTIMQKGFYLREFSKLQVQLIIAYARSYNTNSFLEVWEEYVKRIRCPEEILEIMTYTKRLVPPFSEHEIVQKKFKELFKLHYGDEDQLLQAFA
ncbi:hypothetical protein FGO68_gene9403 [Halteria grandinella]|uniref:SET domain-containing protein n=1 Tax=Halteria grandinella TaxID=5974 RepID=A0A8J8T5H8_HALGN|nr:hypothetical protein FGO68_gene9403 [Halteria grandinella]